MRVVLMGPFATSIRPTMEMPASSEVVPNSSQMLMSDALQKRGMVPAVAAATAITMGASTIEQTKTSTSLFRTLFCCSCCCCCWRRCGSFLLGRGGGLCRLK